MMDDDICTHSSSLINITDSSDLFFLLFFRNKTIGLTSLANAWVLCTTCIYSPLSHCTAQHFCQCYGFHDFAMHVSCNVPISGMLYLQYLGAWWGVGVELTCPNKTSLHTWGTNLCTMPLHIYPLQIPHISLSCMVWDRKTWVLWKSQVSKDILAQQKRMCILFECIGTKVPTPQRRLW